jgi:citrate lyase subunit beta / citryl-CoA lyase
MVMLPTRFAVQAAHLTVPATRWQMVEGAVAKSGADLVMLDLEDSIPRDDAPALELGRQNAVRALRELDWGRKLRFFRPRGLDLDPALEDLRFVVPRVREKLEGIVVPKVVGPDDVVRFDRGLADIERAEGLEVGGIKMQVLIESVTAEEQAFEVARASSRLTGLVFGAFDYWSSLRMALTAYRFDHPAVDAARLRIVKAAASVGIPAIAEMTTDYPTKEKSQAEREQSIATCRRHAEHARDLGMTGKWAGHPAQVAPLIAVFAPSADVVSRALDHVRAFRAAELRGLGAIMVEGQMADRATDRMNRMTLAAADARGMLDAGIVDELGLREPGDDGQRSR